MNPIDKIMDDWASNLENRDPSGILKTIHKLAKKIDGEETKTQDLALNIFNKLESHHLGGETNFKLKHIEKEDIAPFLKDLEKILFSIFSSSPEESNFCDHEVNELYHLWESHTVDQLISEGDEEACLQLIESMPNRIYKNELTNKFFYQAVTNQNLELIESLFSNHLIKFQQDSENELYGFMCSSDLGRQTFAITSPERLENAIIYQWPLQLIVDLLPNEEESKERGLQGTAIHSFIHSFVGIKNNISPLVKEVIVRLVQEGADVNAVSEYGNTILDLVLDNKLLERNQKSILLSSVLKLGATGKNEPLILHLWKANPLLTMDLTKQGLLDPNSVDVEGNTLLHRFFLNFHEKQYTTNDPSRLPSILFNDKILGLIQLGLDPHKPNAMGVTPFYQAFGHANTSDSSCPVSFSSLLAMNSGFTHLYFKALPEKDTLPPLHSAILERKNEEIEQLLNHEDLDVNETDTTGITPLHLAIDSGDKALVNMLITRGASITYPDANGLTPLHVASLHQNLEILDLLLDNPEFQSSDEKEISNEREVNPITPLNIALMFKNIEMVDRLTKNLDLTKTPISIGALIPNNRTTEEKKEEQILRLLIERGWVLPSLYAAGDIQIKPYGHKIFKLLKENNIEWITINFKQQVKRLSHALSLKGTITHISFDKNFSEINLEGSVAELHMIPISKATQLFFKKFPKIPFPESMNRDIKYMLNFAADIHSHSPEKILKRITDGKPVLLPAGCYGHSVEVLFTHDEDDKPVLVLGNRGAESRIPVEFYHYNPSQLTPEILTQILDTVDSPSVHFHSFFYHELQDLLSLESSKNLQTLQRRSHLDLEYQTVGNCTWTSIEAVMWAQFQLAAQKMGGSSTQRLEYGNTIYTHWRLFVSALQMENYIQYLEKEQLSPETDDFLVSFQEFWQVENDETIDIRIREQILALNERCFALFPTRMENPIPSQLLKVQKVFWNQWESVKNIFTGT